MIHPKEMKKVSIIGPKKRLDDVTETLHDMGILHVDDYAEHEDDLDIGSPDENAEELSDMLVKLRSVRSQLPETESEYTDDGMPVDERIDALHTEIESLKDELDRVRNEKDELRERLDKLDILDRLGLDADDINEYKSVDVHVGTVQDRSFTKELPNGRYELYHDNNTIVLFVDKELDVQDALRSAGFSEIDMTDVLGIEATVDHVKTQTQRELDKLERREEELETDLHDLARDWRAYLDKTEYELASELEKANAPLQFGVTDQTFVAEGWVPEDRYGEVVDRLYEITQGNIHIEELDVDEHEAPVEHDNPAGVDNFETLVSYFGIPSYGEVDPTFLLLTFPLLFGFMLGDLGYGIATFAIFYLLYRQMPQAEQLWKSLMFASVATMVFGLIYAEAFGFIIFGEESVLAALTGLHFFAEIPILYHRAHHLDQVMQMALAIGVVHVNLGYLIGAYNEYISHGLLEAVFAKLSWIVLEIGAVLWYLTGSMPLGLGVMLAGVVMLFKGEGIEGVVEIPSLLSNILSYLRILGVVIAVLALAQVVNVIAQPLFQSGNIIMIGLGLVVLVLGHTLNTFIKLIESGLQGIRLHYVEFFTKFFHGGGQYYNPFGSKDHYRG